MPRRLPLGPTLIAALVLAALLPALLVAWLLSSNSSQSINTLAENAMSQAAHRVDVGALAHLGESHTVVNALVPPFQATGAEATRTRHWLSDTASFETMAYALTQQSANVPYLYYGTADGAFFGLERENEGFIVRQIRPGDSGRRHYLVRQPGDRSQLVRVETSLYDPRTRPWYQLALATGKRTFTDVYRSAVKAQFDLTLAQPIFGEDGRTVLGVMAVDMSLARLTDLIRSTRISENAVTYLVDSKGLLVASSVDEELSHLVEGQHQRISPLQSTDPLVRESFQQLSTPSHADTRRNTGLVRLQMEPTWQHRLGFASNRLIALQRPFGGRFDLNWQLIVVAPEDDFTRQVIQARQWALIVIAVLIGLCSVLAFLVARGLSSQFQLLNESATAVGAGLVPPVQESAPFREVRHLSRVMHDSAQKLQAYTGEIQHKNEQLRDAAQLLEERVRQRTAELAASREEALAAVQAKAGFLAVMSHEIRTPLNGVVGMSELLAETPLDDTQKELFGVLRVSSAQLQSVVGDILDFSRIEAGRLELEQRPFDLHAAIRQAQDIMHLAALEKGLQLRVDIAPDVPTAIVGDITRLRQVLLNLLSNAIKFTHTGEVLLRVWSDPAAPAPAGAAPLTLRFAVSDTGVGIRPERIPELFQPFAQGDTSTTRVYGGTGLGLMICKHLVALMGGGIDVSSQPGSGATFVFSIQATVADAGQIEATPPARPAHHPHAQRVLVVDDNEVNLKVASAMLLRLGYRHDSIGSGTAALAAVQAARREGQPYHVVLLDRHMPDLDGIATAEVLQRELGPDCPSLICISASSLGEDRQRCLDAGMADYLPKPLSLTALAHALQARDGMATTRPPDPPAMDPGAGGTAAPGDWVDAQRWASFAEFDDASGSLRRDIITEFLDTLQGRLDEILVAASANDHPRLLQAAHFLKGAAINVGATRMGSACDAIEHAATQGQTDSRAVALLAASVPATRNALDRIAQPPMA